MRLVLALCLLLLAACGSVPDLVAPSAPPTPPAGSYWISLQERVPLTTQERERLFGRITAGLGSAKAERSTPGVLELRITVVGFRQLGEAARQGGVVGGADYVESVVRLVDPAGAVVSEQQVLTSDRRAVGGGDHLLEQHADEIVRALARR